MDRKLAFVLIMFVLLSFLIDVVRVYPVDVEAVNGHPVHNLDTGLNYTTIQEAIDSSQTLDGHTILVESGTYYEHVVVDKSISLIGEDRDATIIDGNQSGGALHVRSDDIFVSNITIRNCRTERTDSSICVDHADNCRISNVTIKNSTSGIFLFYSTNSTISGNSMNDDDFSFGIHGEELSDFMHSVDTTNLVNGRPTYYLLNQNDVLINPITYPKIGYLALVNSDNVTVDSLTLTNNWQGLLFVSTSNSRITRNHVADNMMGISLVSSDNNVVSKNNIQRNGHGTAVGAPGITLSNSTGNIIIENYVSNNFIGIGPHLSSDNHIYHNSFTDTKWRQILNHDSVNIWDDGLEGNYWNDYYDADSSIDGIGDIPYVIDENNTDHYPLMGLFSNINTSSGKHVNVISNSTIEDFEYFESNSRIRMHVSNMTSDQTYGFCRISIPKDLISPPYNIIINDGTAEPLFFNETICDNGTHRWIYFAYEHSTLEIVIIPESPSFLILPLFMIATLLTVIVHGRKEHK